MRSIGSKVKLFPENTEQYPEEYQGVVLIITHITDKYMPAKEFFARGQPEGYHPGYDTTANGIPLYDLKVESSDEEFPFSLYEWEIQNA